MVKVAVTNDNDILYNSLSNAFLQNELNIELIKVPYEKLEQIYNTQIPYISLANSKYNVLYNSNLVGDVSPNWYNVFYNIEGWYK